MPSDNRSRRQFLRGSVAAALAAGIAGCGGDDPEETPPPETPEPTETEGPPETETETPTATATPVPEIVERYGDRFGSIVNLAAAGADLEGNNRIDDVLNEAIADDSLLYFPSGEYKVGPLRIEDVSNFGFASLPDDDVTLVPAEPSDEMNYRFFEFEGVEECFLDGITFDFRGPKTGGTVKIHAQNELEVRNLRIRGQLPDRVPSAKPVAFSFAVLGESGTGLVENVVAKDGGHEGGSAVGIYVGKDHAGELTVKDCVIENFPNNGLYASAPGRDLEDFNGADGAVHVRGGRFANNNIANVRLGSTGSTAKDVEIVIDDVPPVPESSTLNARGLRLRGQNGQVVENCEITIGEDAGEGFGAIVFHPASGEATIRDTQITVDRDNYPAIRLFPPDDDDDSGPVFENVTIGGSAARGDTVAVEGRDGTAFRDCTVEQSGEERSGMAFADSSDCLVADTTIRVTGTPIRTVDATVERKNTTTESWNESSQTDQ